MNFDWIAKLQIVIKHVTSGLNGCFWEMRCCEVGVPLTRLYSPTTKFDYVELITHEKRRLGASGLTQKEIPGDQERLLRYVYYSNGFFKSPNLKIALRRIF